MSLHHPNELVLIAITLVYYIPSQIYTVEKISGALTVCLFKRIVLFDAHGVQIKPWSLTQIGSLTRGWRNILPQTPTFSVHSMLAPEFVSVNRWLCLLQLLAILLTCDIVCISWSYLLSRSALTAIHWILPGQIFEYPSSCRVGIWRQLKSDGEDISNGSRNHVYQGKYYSALCASVESDFRYLHDRVVYGYAWKSSKEMKFKNGCERYRKQVKSVSNIVYSFCFCRINFWWNHYD